MCFESVVVAGNVGVGLKRDGLFFFIKREFKPISRVIGTARGVEEIQQIVAQLIADTIWYRLDVNFRKRSGNARSLGAASVERVKPASRQGQHTKSGAKPESDPG